MPDKGHLENMAVLTALVENAVSKAMEPFAGSLHISEDLFRNYQALERNYNAQRDLDTKLDQLIAGQQAFAVENAKIKADLERCIDDVKDIKTEQAKLRQDNDEHDRKLQKIEGDLQRTAKIMSWTVKNYKGIGAVGLFLAGLAGTLAGFWHNLFPR